METTIMRGFFAVVFDKYDLEEMSEEQRKVIKDVFFKRVQKTDEFKQMQKRKMEYEIKREKGLRRFLEDNAKDGIWF